jgi:hypothetical protein
MTTGIAPDGFGTDDGSGANGGAPHESSMVEVSVATSAPPRGRGRLVAVTGAVAVLAAAGGFLVGRVLVDADEDGQLDAAPGVQIGAAGRDDLADCAEGEPCLRLFDDDPRLTGFRDVGATTTGASGAFLLVHTGAGTLQLRFSATIAGTEYETLTVGASAGRGFHVSFVPIAAP